MTRRWKCTVCGYLHRGGEAPRSCPVCGADRAEFIPFDAGKAAGPPPLLAIFKLHPVAAHFPGGLIPTAAFFVALGFVLGHAAFEVAAFWLIMVATAVVPVSMGSGYYDWHKYFAGRRAPIFFKKLGLALILLILGLMAIAVRTGHPELLTAGGWRQWLYLGCLAGMLGCVALLGHYGAILAALGAREQPFATPSSPAD